MASSEQVFTPLRDLKQFEAHKVDGRLTLMWADSWCAGRDVTPASGVGLYDGRPVVFCIRDPQVRLKLREYMLYELSSDSWTRVKNNRLAYRKVFGLRDEFGRTHDIMAKAEIRTGTYHYFTPQYVAGDLEVRALGYITQANVANPFPHNDIGSHEMEIINQLMIDDDSVSKPEAELPYSPEQVMIQLASKLAST